MAKTDFWQNVTNSATRVSTMAALTALTDRPDYVVLGGYAAPNDGGGGLFYWTGGSTATVDGGTIISPSGSVAGRYRRIFNGPIHAAWFGFVADNNSASGTANSAALNAAAVAAAALGVEVVVPPGISFLASTVTVGTTQIVGGEGWDGITFKPTSDAIGVMFSCTGTGAAVRGVTIDGSAIAVPTFTGVRIDSPGFNDLRDLYIYGCGVGLDIISCNAGVMTNLRIQASPICLRTGGTTGKYPGDMSWDMITLIPTAAGYGWIIDGNTNAQSCDQFKTIGGARGVWFRGAGASTGIPDGFFFSELNVTAASGANVEITKGYNIIFDNPGSVGGSTGGEGILVNAASPGDVDKVEILCDVRGNFKEGVKWISGANPTFIGANVYGNSNGGGSGTYSNIYMGAGAVGLFMAVGVMAGLSSVGNVFGNVQGPARYGIEIAAGAFTDTGNFPGRIQIVGCMLDGNVVGTLLNSSSQARVMIRGCYPTASNNVIAYRELESPTGITTVVTSSVNFNSANTDYPIVVPLPAGFTRYVVQGLRISAASASLTTATCGLFTAAAAGGTAIVTTGSVITVSSASENSANNTQSFTIATGATQSFTASTLYFRVQTAQGSPATGLVSLYLTPLS